MPEKTSEKRPEISVIVPVFNVEEYLDECMESFASQTFGDFELLLIDDGSSDGSPEKCGLWAEKDSRIRVFHKENGGVSSARNLGIEEARGRYLAFADPDDWVDSRYLEKLYNAAEEAGADVAECDLWRVDGRSGKKIYRSCGGCMGVPWTREEHMIYGPTASYKAISKRSLWIDNGLRFPDCSFESPAVYALVIALSKKTVNVSEALYYYRRFRPQSLIETGYALSGGRPNNSLGVEAMRQLKLSFEQRGLAEKYGAVLERVIKYRLSDILATQFHRKSPEDFAETAENFRALLEDLYPGRNARYIAWGGYNLGRVLVHLPLLNEPQLRFSFSSLISLLGEGGGAAVSHKNRYREMMLQREEAQSFRDILALEKPGYLFIDLLEERFDILKRSGRYVTMSDARQGAVCGADAEGAAVPRDSAECLGLFRKACGVLSELLKKESPCTRAVILESYLCEEKGDLKDRVSFEDLPGIEKTNGLLKKHYEILKEALPGAVVIQSAKAAESGGTDLYFTDKLYEYGAVPSHLNELANRRIAAHIQEILGL